MCEERERERERLKMKNAENIDFIQMFLVYSKKLVFKFPKSSKSGLV